MVVALVVFGGPGRVHEQLGNLHRELGEVPGLEAGAGQPQSRCKVATGTGSAGGVVAPAGDDVVALRSAAYGVDLEVGWAHSTAGSCSSCSSVMPRRDASSVATDRFGSAWRRPASSS